MIHMTVQPYEYYTDHGELDPGSPDPPDSD